MRDTREARIEELFALAAALPPHERTRAVRDAAGDDEPLARDVFALLEHLDDEFLDPDRFATERAGLALEGVLPVAARIGRYTVLGTLGSGGMGVVYLAEQERPRRQVALKVIAGAFVRDSSLARFEREAELLGRLQHPGITHIYEAGVAEYGFGPRPFIAMERIEGEPITTHARKASLDTRARVALMAQVCDAVEHAHQRGVIHRDIKPGNIFVDAHGNPKVLDFGIGRALDDSGNATATGGVLGTLAYIAPEQLRDSSQAGVRSDVYALGAVLFEMLAGRTPHLVREMTFTEAIRVISEHGAPRLSAVNPEMKGDLDAVVGKALDRDPERRYRTAGELGEDLRRWLDGEPILARRDSLLEALGRTAQRNTAALRVGAGVLVILAVAGAGAASLAWRNSTLAARELDARRSAEGMLETARRERARADDESRRLRERLYSSNIGHAQAALVNADVARVRQLLDACPEDLAGWEHRYLRAASDQSDRAIVANAPGLSYLAADPDSNLLITLIIGTDAIVRTLDTGKERTRLAIPGGVFRIESARADRAVFLTSGAGRVDRVALDERFEETSRTTLVDDDAGHRLLHAPRDTSEDVIRVDGRGLVTRLSPDPRRRWAHEGINTVAIDSSRDAGKILLGGLHGGVRSIDARTGRVLWSSEHPDAEVRGVAFSPDADRAATVSIHALVTIHDAATGEVLRTIQTPLARASSLAWTDDARTILVGASNGALCSIDAHTGAHTILRGHTAPITSIAPIGDDRAVTIARDGEVRWWSLLDSARAAERSGQAVRSGAVGLVALCESFLIAGFGGESALLDAAGAMHTLEPTRDGAVWRADAHPFTQTIAFPRADGTIELRSVDNPSKSTVFRVTDVRIAKAVFSPDGSRIAGVDDRGNVFILDALSGAILARAQAHEGQAVGVRWQPDATVLWTCGTDGALRRWRYDESAHAAISQEREWALSSAPVFEVAVSRDGKNLAVGGEDGRVYLIDVPTGEARSLIGHAGPVFGLAFHPEGRRLASVGFDSRLRVWDTGLGEEVLQLTGSGASLFAVTFSESGDRLAASGADGRVYVWSATHALSR